MKRMQQPNDLTATIELPTDKETTKLKVTLPKHLSEALLNLIENDAQASNLLEAHVDSIKALFKRFLGWDNMTFEDVDVVIRSLKVFTSQWRTPRQVLTLSGIENIVSSNEESMMRVGITNYSNNGVQLLAHTHRFFEQKLSFSISYFYDNYADAAKQMQNLSFLMRAKTFRYSILTDGVDHDVTLEFDMNVDLGKLPFDGDLHAIGMFQTSFTLRTVVQTMTDRPVVVDRRFTDNGQALSTIGQLSNDHLEKASIVGETTSNRYGEREKTQEWLTQLAKEAEGKPLRR